MARFSSRSGFLRAPNALAQADEQRAVLGLPALDLTNSNPTNAGLAFPPDGLAGWLSASAQEPYAPEPLGSPSARGAVAAGYYQGQVRAEQIALTASTSEAYSLLFKLLCNPGDQVLVAQPGYPLLSFLTTLECVEVQGYPLSFDGAWRLDVQEVEALVGERTRAVLVVSPHHPTGWVLKRHELEGLTELCHRKKLALLIDEVFADFQRGTDVDRRCPQVGAQKPCLTFTLSGLSKVALYPQLKLGWTCVEGPAALRAEALARLELLGDTYLSVGSPVQHALPALLASATQRRQPVLERLAKNRGLLRDALLGTGWSLLPSEGGWSAVVRLPEFQTDEAVALAALRHGVRVHPGHFYDFPRGQYLVLSLLTPPEVLAQALPLLLQG